MESLGNACITFCAIIGMITLSLGATVACHLVKDRWGERRKLLDRYDQVVADKENMARALIEKQQQIDALHKRLREAE